MQVRKRRWELLIWSFLLSLSFYPDYFGFLAWFSLVRPIMIIAPLKGRDAFKAAYFFAFFFNLFSLYWVAIVTPPGMIMAVIIVSFYYAIILTLFNKLYNFREILGIVALPMLWVGMEYFRTLSEFAFPWSDLGYTQAYYLYILQIVSVISVHGLSLLIVVVNILLWQILRRSLTPEKRLTSFFVSIVIIAFLLAYGWIVTPRFPLEGEYKIALLQGSVPLEVKWKEGNQDYSLNLYDSLAQTVPDEDVKLFVWPETSVPCYLSHHYGCRHSVRNIARHSNNYHLVGALGATVDKDGREMHYNSCYQVNPNGQFEKRYDKVKLVPFSEQVPYQDNLPFLKKSFLQKYLTFIETYNVQWWSDFYPGKDSSLIFNLPDADYGVLICFESAFPEYARRMVLEGAGFLVGITNDTWFKRSVGIHMHSRVFLTRAVENRCWAVRTANSGISYFVDGYGRIRNSLDAYEVAAMTGKIKRLEGYSFFTSHGDIAGKSSFLITISIIGILLTVWILRKIWPQKS